MVEPLRNCEDTVDEQNASCFKVVSVSFGSGKQIYSRTDHEIELTRFHSVTFEIISGVRDYE